MAEHASAINAGPAERRGIMAVNPPLPPAILDFSAGCGRAVPCINSRPAEEHNKPWSAPAREARSGRSDRIDRRLAAQDARDIGRALALQLFERLDRIERGMRREDNVVAADQPRILRQRLDRDHVECGAAELA